MNHSIIELFILLYFSAFLIEHRRQCKRHARNAIGHAKQYTKRVVSVGKIKGIGVHGVSRSCYASDIAMFHSARTTAFSAVVRPAFSSPPCLARALEARSVSRYYRSRSAATFPVRVMRSKLVETSRGAVANVACTLLLTLATRRRSRIEKKKKRRFADRRGEATCNICIYAHIASRYLTSYGCFASR